MIKLHELHFRYRNSPREVLDNVTLHFPAGRIVGLLGKNGTGKSTLLYLMAGLLRPQQGEVRFEQRPVCHRTPAVLAELFVVPEHIELPSMKLSRYVSLHLLGKLTWEEMRNGLETAIHQFAKRQMTYLRGMERRGTQLIWLDGDLPTETLIQTIVESLRREHGV